MVMQNFLLDSTALVASPMLLALSACSESTARNEPKSGIYLGSDANRYGINTNGPAAITLTRGDDLCVLFWKRRDSPIKDGIVSMNGTNCGQKVPKTKWKVVFSYARSDVFVITPPTGEKFEVKYESELKQPS